MGHPVRIFFTRLFLFSLFALLIAAVGLPLGRYTLYVYRHAGVESKRALGNVPQFQVLERYRLDLVKRFAFNEANALKEWEEKIFKGRVLYAIERADSLSFVRAKSDKTASALYYKIQLDARQRSPYLRWKWRVNTFPRKQLAESLETKDEDDFAARVYVIFPARFITNSKVIEYIWSEKLPKGLTGISPYSNNIRLMVLESAAAGSREEWRSEERDIASDYRALFGEWPRKDVGAVAFMTDSDTTETSADSFYADIELGYREGKDRTTRQEAKT